MKERAAIVGLPVFVVFPDNPDDPATANHEEFRAALERVRQTGEPEAVPVYQYDSLARRGRRVRDTLLAYERHAGLRRGRRTRAGPAAGVPVCCAPRT